MLHFFRKMRKALVPENRLGKYFFYAIGEIVLVVLGILIALQVNNWNEYRKKRITETNYLTRLHSDLQKDTTYLSERINIYHKNLDSSAEFIQAMYESQNSTEDFMKLISKSNWFAEELILQDITFSEIISTGDFGIVLNNILKEDIINYYKIVETHSIHVKEMNVFGLEMFREVYPLIAKYFESTWYNNEMRDEADWQFINEPTSLTFKKLESTAFYYSHKFATTLGYCYDLKDRADKLITAINLEINKDKEPNK